MNFLTRLAIGLTAILALYAFVPKDVLQMIGNFAIGWMIMNIVDYFFGEKV